MRRLDLTKYKWVSRKYDSFRKFWYKYTRSGLSIVGMAIVISVIIVAIFAPYVAPYPEDVGVHLNLQEASQPPSWKHLCGTDQFGRDVLSRIFFGYRFSLLLAIFVIGLSAPPGIIIGLIAGYYRGSKADTILMRIVDIFLSVPPLILALSIAAVLEPNIFNAMTAVTLMWWPWYARLVYSISSSLQHELFVQASEITGATSIRIIFKQLLPNCISPILTKMTLDFGYVIIIGSCLSFIGLGVQPPKPGLGTMVAQGSRLIPESWWIAIFPAFAIVLVVLGFNLVGDGLRDMLAIEEE